MAFTDVTSSFWSTMTIDAAAMNKPSVLCNFDLANVDPEKSIKRSHRLEHVRRLADSNAAEVVEDSADLAEAIHSALNDTNNRLPGRKFLTESMCGAVDGGSADRVAAAVLRLLAPIDSVTDLLEIEDRVRSGGTFFSTP